MNTNKAIDQAWEDCRANGDMRPPPPEFIVGFLAGRETMVQEFICIPPDSITKMPNA